MLQVLVQVLAALIDAGTVCHLSSVACPQGFHCPASGFVSVEVTVDALVPVQMFQSLFHVGDGVQHKAVTRCQTERDGGQEVHKALEHAAHVRRDVPRLDQRHVLWWYATLETAASGFIAARHVRKADGKVPLTTHAVVQAAAVAGCNGIRDASFLQILRQRRAEQRDGFHSLKGRKHQKIKRNASSRMIEYIQGIRLIRAFNLNGNKFERLEHAFRELKRESIYLEAAPAPTITLASTLLNGGLVLIMLLGFSMLLDAQVSIPVYIMFLLAGSAIYAPLINAMTFIALINYMKLSAERIDALCNTPVLPEGTIEEVTGSEIEFRNVDFSYDEDIPVLRDVSLVIPEKRLTALVGPSGSGKTTLTRLIARFWDVNKGEILLGGRNVRDYTLHTLMQQISIVFQDVYLFNDTIYNNIRVGRETATQEEIEAAARKAQCHEFITAMPDGYDTLVGEGGSTFSGGEKQRISIARAILKDAPIVLLDEATASLDPENEVHIQDAINDLVKEKTVVIIAHRLGTLVNADNIVVINQGRVVQQGKHQTLLEEGGLYRNLWQEQQRVKRWKF